MISLEAYAIRQTRKSLGMTQTQLAELIGIKRTLIADIEIGRRSIDRNIGDRIKFVLQQRKELITNTSEEYLGVGC